MDARRCGFCRKIYSTAVIGGETAFYENRTNGKGWQPDCRRCTWRLGQEPHRRWGKFLKVVEKEGVADQWTQEIYEELLAPNGVARCHWCGVDPLLWARGHCIDRVSSARGHTVDNCVPACWPCNKTKGPMKSQLWLFLRDSLVDTYGRGRIPWDEFGFEPCLPPDLSQWEIPDPQLSLLRGLG